MYVTQVTDSEAFIVYHVEVCVMLKCQLILTRQVVSERQFALLKDQRYHLRPQTYREWPGVEHILSTYLSLPKQCGSS